MSDTTTSQTRRPVMLCILDGWGQSDRREANAIALGHTPIYDRLRATCPTGLMDASGGHVGLPDDQMGNSEVGHMNLGAGRVVMQDLPRISSAVADGSLATNGKLLELVEALKRTGGACHLIGLLSPGGVHSHQDHMVALAKAVASHGVPVKVHGFLDGRDTPPSSARGFVAKFVADLEGVAEIATLCGRFYAMDRDKRWDRVSEAYHMLVAAKGEAVADPMAALDVAEARGETDEFILPSVIGAYDGMKDGDALLIANYRADRVRELGAALVDHDFTEFEVGSQPKFAAQLGMSSYSSALDRFLGVMFPAADIENTLGEVVAGAGLRQLRIAETEKYPHVTFFFNGGREDVYEGEDRILVPSPQVRTYDEQPEMSAPEVTDKLVEAIESGTYDLIVANFANSDMVGHTGDLSAAIAAVEAVDICLGRIETALTRAGGVMLLTADHGNCEQMVDPDTGAAHTAHTTNLVPTILVNAPQSVEALRNGRLADVAPTLLELLGLPVPAEFTGVPLTVPSRLAADGSMLRAIA